MKKIFKSIIVLALMFAVTGCGKPSLSKYIEDIQPQIEKEMKTYEGQGLNLEVIARDNNLVYVFTYDAKLTEGVDMKVLGETLETSLASEAINTTFTNVYDEAKKAVKEIDGVVLEYYSSDKELIASAAFPK